MSKSHISAVPALGFGGDDAFFWNVLFGPLLFLPSFVRSYKSPCGSADTCSTRRHLHVEVKANINLPHLRQLSEALDPPNQKSTPNHQSYASNCKDIRSIAIVRTLEVLSWYHGNARVQISANEKCEGKCEENLVSPAAFSFLVYFACCFVGTP